MAEPLAEAGVDELIVDTPPRRRGRRLLWAAMFLVLAGLVAFAVASQTDDLHRAWRALAHVDGRWLALAALVEALSFVANAIAIRALLPAPADGQAPGIIALTGITLSGQAVMNLMPAGMTGMWWYSYRRLRKRGVEPVTVTWALLVVGLFSTATLAILALIGAEIEPHDKVPGLRETAIAAIVVLVALGVGLRYMHRWRWGTEVLERVRRRIARKRDEGEHLRDRLRAVRLSRTRFTIALVATGCVWLADAGALALAFPAVHGHISLAALAVGYTAGQLATQLPVTPGGLGVVEVGITAALVALGGKQDEVLPAVLLYRLMAYWAVLPLGAASYALLRRAEARRPS
ncbi:MAG TPA: lysylphosphatidylglycerol synthase transmembrane domain-containing protein [Mycobacteriales bacterium]|nr:lysylphosphatidylglycerol synthase transmembrane domain-containing protein [Mycobacteriales bacterium]